MARKSRDTKRSNGWFSKKLRNRRPVDRAMDWKRGQRLAVEPLEDRRVLAVLIGGGAAGGGDDIEALNDLEAPLGQSLGSEPTVSIANFRVDDNAADPTDVFRYRAHRTGKLVVEAFATNDQIEIDITTAGGESLIEGARAPSEVITLPAVEGELYYFSVTDTNGELGDGTVYALEIENVVAPVPSGVVLDPDSDTGASNSDGVTADTTPTFVIQNDLETFLEAPQSDVQIGTIDSEDAVGYDTDLVITNRDSGAVTVVDADRIGASAAWEATAPNLPAGEYIVSARTRVIVAVDPELGDDPGDVIVLTDDASPVLGVASIGTAGYSLLSEPIFITILGDVAPPIPAAPDLIAASDTGMDATDDVTNLQEVTVSGIGPENLQVDVFARRVIDGVPSAIIELVGEGTIGSDNSDGTPGDGLGLWQINLNALADGVYDLFAVFEDDAGNRSPDGDPLRVTIDTVAPNTPFLDLTTDTGRSSVDDITMTTLPTVVMRGNATTDGGEVNAPPNDVKFRLYVRPDGNIPVSELLVYDSFSDTGDFTTLASITRQISLTLNDPNGSPIPDGVHNFKLEVEDRAGNISEDFLLPFEVDTVVPPVSFGAAATADDGLAGGSDTGVPADGATAGDRITSDTTPSFFGQAEANSIVRLFADLDGNGAVNAGDLLLGQTVALPESGNNAFADGYWEITSSIDLNESTIFPLDGVRNLLVTAEDVAGNVNSASDGVGDTEQQLEIFLDTQGPRVAAVLANGESTYDLFDPKPSINGPTPLISSLELSFTDAPTRAADFQYPAINPTTISIGDFSLVGDDTGIAAIDGFIVVDDTAAGVTNVTLTFATPLVDDRYTLTVNDSLFDSAGNQLDGESNATQPLDDPIFPTGDTVPGGDFSARFTVDSRPEIGTFVAENISIDANGNFVWDPASAQAGDATNRDLSFTLPLSDENGAIAPGGYTVNDLVFAGKYGVGGSNLIVGDNAIFVIDVSGSTSSTFQGDPVGDQNNDGSPNTILDAEIAAFIVLNDELISRGLGNTAQVGIVGFTSSAFQVDMDPIAPGVQLTTTPLADTDGNMTPDVIDALRTLDSGGGTDFFAPLQQAISTLDGAGLPNGSTNVIFLSDGQASSGFGALVTEIRDTRGHNLRAFGVGTGSDIFRLQEIDPNAVQFTNTNELLGFFQGGGGAVGGAGGSSGFDTLAAFGFAAENSEWRWLIDRDHDGVVSQVMGSPDLYSVQPLLDGLGFDIRGAIPVAGNFDGNAANGDEIGLYNQGSWVFDVDRDFVLTAADAFVTNGLLGHPVIGDFDGDGADDAAVFNNNQFFFNFAIDGLADGFDDSFVWGYPGVLDRPVAADFDQDGIDDLGLWVPRNSSATDRPTAEWYLKLSGNPDADGRPANYGTAAYLDHPFTPTPFGNDLYAEFGDELALPIAGNFDPPVATPTPTINEPVIEFGPVTPVPAAVRAALVMEGDFDANGRVDDGDLYAWRAAFGTPAAHADANGDGVVNIADYTAYRDAVGSTAGGFETMQETGPTGPFATAALAGDFNGDSVVDAGDLDLLLDSFGTDVGGTMIDNDELSALLSNWGANAATPPLARASAPNAAEEDATQLAFALLVEDSSAAVAASAAQSIGADSAATADEEQAKERRSGRLRTVVSSWGAGRRAR